jgi:hypothetical protein
MNLDIFGDVMNATLALHKPDGRVFENIRASVTGKSIILIDDVRLPIEIGDTLTQALPNGLTETFIIDDPGFFPSTSGVPAHFQVKVHRAAPEKAALPAVLPDENKDQVIFPMSHLEKTRRGYLITTGRQVNGCFKSGWYDACAVMMRRLLETAIIEAFEAKKLDGKIKTSQGEFVQLTALITAAVSEPSWNLSRKTKQALPQLRDVGHVSAHSRRFTAQKGDIEKVQAEFRVAVEEFLHLAELL